MHPSTYDALADAAASYGLLLRGGLHADTADAVPALTSGSSCRTVILIGNAGAAMWPVFQASPEARSGLAHALDAWTRRVVGGLAGRFGGEAVYPFGGPPFHPFIRWAQRAEPVVPSPIGMLVHPDYGLWHAYRGALLFAESLDLPPREARPAPCETCTARPCLTTCPVGAFTAGGYDVAACARHIATPEGADCIEDGCRARRACPAGADYRYAPGQAAWHMRAFAAARNDDTKET